MKGIMFIGLLCTIILLVPCISAQQTTTLWYPYAEWVFTNPSFSGNPFDLQAQATFSDGRSPNLFYDGSDTWKLRYMCTETGTFTFTTSSSDSDLNGLSGSVICEDNPGAMGLLVADGNNNNKFYVRGWERAIVPAWVMMPGLTHSLLDTWMQNNIVRSGFIGAHTTGGINNRWYDWDCDGTRSDCSSENPDPRTFRAYEDVLDKLYENNAFVHLWMFGDCERDTCDKYHDDDARQERLRNYLADRLGAIPNWMMGEGYDNWEDDSIAYANKWFNDINDRIAWPHLLGMRSLKNTYIDICTECNYHSYENIADPDDWTYSRFCDSYDQGTDMPVFEEDRFRYKPSDPIFRTKNIEDINEQRHWLWWTAMSGGVGAIWGYLEDSDGHHSNVNGYPNDWHALIKGWHDFWYATETDSVHRFMLGMERCNGLTDGYALCDQDDNYVFYKENTNYINLDISGISGQLPAVAMDTKTGYFIDLGDRDSGYNRFDAPHSSDWAVGVGNFAGAECGDTSCDTGETCSSCPEDCGECEYHWLEAEYPDTITPPMQAADDPAASEGRYIHVPNGAGSGGDAAYDVDITVPGDYVLWGRVIAPDGEDDSFLIEIDSSGDNLWDVELGTSWHWDQVNDRYVADPVKFTLSGGSHTIKVKQREDGTMIDKLLLTNNPSYSPSGEGGPAENIPNECPCTLPYICCNDECVLPACSIDSECGTDTGCRTWTCSSPGTCTASCSYQDITSCTDGDGCCPSGCSVQNDNDCDSPLCEGLVMLMHMDNDPDYGETPTHVYDFSGEGNHGTAYGSPVHNPSGGMFSGTFQFDGMDDYISVPHDHSIDFADESFSYAFWIKGEISDVFFDDRILVKGTSSGGCGAGNRYEVRVSSGNLLYFTIDDDSFKTDLYRDYSGYLDNTWHHLTFTRDAPSNEMRVYLDGYQDGVTETDGSGDISNSCPLYIARTSEDMTEQYTEIAIDDFAIWNRTLSEQEILGLSDNSAPLSCGHICIHQADKPPCNGRVDMQELVDFIDHWKYDSTAYPMREMMEAVVLYYNP